MTKPTFSKRLAGRPPVTAALFLFYGLAVLGWFKGGVPWWLASIAVIAAMRTFRAFRAMRAYSPWLASWQEMGTDDTGPPGPLPEKRQGRLPLLLTVLLAVVLPVAYKGSTPPPGVMWLWAFTCLFLVGKATYRLGRVLRRVRPVARRAVKKQSVDDDAPVAWLLPRASASPSRADAERRLPEYSARLLNAGVENAERPVLVRGA